ncbi:hypothetical protein ACQP2F_41885 [Actinoplanes sp. CA-030573]|uniref:hypothetical protein n=1 Tax=Actinoplanes sp. CA-030573 TaxID=3239898 RepID=UPI003D8CA37C
MEIYTMTQRPSMPLNPACALVEPTAPVWAPAPAAPVALLAAERASVSRVHQVQIQAELAQALPLTDGITGTTGSTSTTGFMGINVSKKRYADGGSGVPPRGRPV